MERLLTKETQVLCLKREGTKRAALKDDEVNRIIESVKREVIG